jgi:hypothetical protein
MRCSSVDPTPAPGVKPGRFATSDFEVILRAGNAEELARVLGAHLEGEPVGTRGFEEREGPLRDLNDADLWDALTDRMATLKVPWFAEHMREELVLHGWDITGDPVSRRLSTPRWPSRG